MKKGGDQLLHASSFFMNETLQTQGIFSQGYGVIAKKVMRDKSLSTGAKALYAYICSFVGAGETAWPGRATVCSDLAIGKDSFAKYLQELKNNNYIKVAQRHNENGQFMGNVYTIITQLQLPDSLEKACPKKSDTAKPDVKKPRPKKPDTVEPWGKATPI